MDLIFNDYLFRWGHIFFGVLWIGLLYYFNFVQSAYLPTLQGEAKTNYLTKLLPNALWYFRWAALFTFLTGCVLLQFRHHVLSLDIMLGATLGTLMFLNVWLIIWPNQQIVIAAADPNATTDDGADPASAALAAKVASQTNTIFSLPMLFFMGSSGHYGFGAGYFVDDIFTFIICAVIVLLIELNAIVRWFPGFAKSAHLVHSGVALTFLLAVILYLQELTEYFSNLVG